MSWQATADRLSGTAMRVLGNAVEILGATGHGILQSPSESILDDVLIVTDYMLELDRATWLNVPEGTGVMVDGVEYRAREQSRVSLDGSSIFVALEPVTTEAEHILDGDFL
jgi:hypothetical protein